MAHGPSPFGVPHRSQGPDHTADDAVDADPAPPRPVSQSPARAPETTEPASEAEMEQHLDRIQASRPLRRAAQRARARTRWWLVALAVVTGLAVVAACGAGAFIVLQENEAEPQAPQDAQGVEDGDAAADAPEVVDPIERRDTDAEPVTVEELFGSGPVAPEGTDRSYEVVETEALDDCAEAGFGELADLLAESGCTQAVRATMAMPDGDRAATAGVLNLEDAAEAASVAEAIGDDIGGGFSVLRAGDDGLGRGLTMLGQITYGHFLLYVVIGNTDGESLPEADDAVNAAVNDIVEVWLVDRLAGRRAVD